MAWFPVGVPAGSEDLPITAREVEHRGYVVDHDGVLMIAQSVRWVGDRRAMVSPTISSLADAVIGLVRQSVPAYELRRFRPVLDPLGTVGRAARSPAGHRDPEVSSWPAAFTTFAGACLRAIAELQSARRGTGVLPLLDTDELYEAWLTIQVRDRLDERLGDRIAPTSNAMAAWESNDALFELWVKPTVPAVGRQFGNAVFEPIVAALLTPDLVLSVSRDEETVLAILDAKAWASLLPADALSQSAKYLYGIRRVVDPEATPAVTSVNLVTCAFAPPLTRPDLARVRVLSATPTRDSGGLLRLVDQMLASLWNDLEGREHLASLR
jgi:hypothetical protein